MTRAGDKVIETRSHRNFRYDIAISFAGEDRQVAEEIATLLKLHDISVFYDDFEKAELWGKDLYEYLARIYSKDARHCIIIISSHYAKKLWTTHERKNAQERAFRDNEDYILPVRLDDTALPGIRDTVGYIDLRKTSIKELINLVLKKLGNLQISKRSEVQMPEIAASTFPTTKVEKKVVIDGLPIHTEVNALLTRFIDLLKAHGIERTQIPRFWGAQFNLSLVDVSTDVNLLNCLNEELLCTVCNKFGVDRAWLEGKSARIYPYLDFYQNMPRFIDFMYDLTKRHKDIRAIAIKSPDDKLKKGGRSSAIALLFETKIAGLDDEPIYKYIVSSDNWDWSYEKSRIQFKAMVFVAWQFNVVIKGSVLPKKAIESLLAGEVFPGPLVDNISRAAWHPDDYIFRIGESAAVEDDEEAMQAREFLEDNGVMQKLELLTGQMKYPNRKQF